MMQRFFALGLLLCGSPALAETWFFEDPPAPAATTAEQRQVRSSSWIGVWLVDEVDGGARIVALVPGGPAERASLAVGDIIVRANTRAVPAQETLSVVLQALEPGQQVDLQVLRQGESVVRTVEVGSRPGTRVLPAAPLMPRYSPPRTRPGLDIEVSEITPALREHYGAPGDAGVLVVRTEDGGLGARSGIRVGDVLIEIAGQPVVSARQVQWLTLPPSGADGGVSAVVVRDRQRQTFRLAALESAGDPAQDEEARRRAEQEAVAQRLRQELERLERRIDEIRRELARLETRGGD